MTIRLQEPRDAGDYDVEVLETGVYDFTLTSIKEFQEPAFESTELVDKIRFTFGKILPNDAKAYVSYKCTPKTGARSNLKKFAPKLHVDLKDDKFWTKENYMMIADYLENCIGNIYSIMVERVESKTTPGNYYNKLLSIVKQVGRDEEFISRMAEREFHQEEKLAVPEPSNPSNRPKVSQPVTKIFNKAKDNLDLDSM